LEAKLKLWEHPNPEMKEESKALGEDKEEKEEFGHLVRVDGTEMSAYNDDINH